SRTRTSSMGSWHATTTSWTHLAPAQVAAATELPDLNRLLHIKGVVLKPISEFVRCEHRARLPVPAAGVEPAASAFSARRSHHLSYTGVGQRSWWDSNPRHALLHSAASPLDHR